MCVCVWFQEKFHPKVPPYNFYLKNFFFIFKKKDSNFRLAIVCVCVNSVFSSSDNFMAQEEKKYGVSFLDFFGKKYRFFIGKNRLFCLKDEGMLCVYG